MSAARRLKTYYSYAGAPGALAIVAFRLFGLPKEILVRSPVVPGIRLRVGTSDLDVYREIVDGEYAFDLPFRPNVILDAGANIGITSIYFAHRFPDAKVIAIEAEPSNYDVLIRNVKAFPSVVPVHAALWNRDGAIVISQPDPTTGASGNWAFVASEDGEGVRVRAVTLQTLMKELGVAAIDLAKIDIEGAEQEVFEDAGWLRGVRALMIELHDRFRPGCSAAVEAALQGFDRTDNGFTSFFLRREPAGAVS